MAAWNKKMFAFVLQALWEKKEVKRRKPLFAGRRRE